MGQNKRSGIRGELLPSVGVAKRDYLEELFYTELMPRLELSFRRNRNSVTGAFYPLTLYGSFCDNAAARMGIMLLQKGIKADVVITASHASLIYKNLIIDPTFYQWYTIRGDEQVPRYVDQNGTERQFTAEELSRGFIGTWEELLNFTSRKRPLSGTIIVPDRNIEVTEDVLRLLLSFMYWDEDLAIHVAIDSDKRPDQMGPQGALWGIIQGEIRTWIKYNDHIASGKKDWRDIENNNIWERMDCCLRPLRTEIGLQLSREMKWCESEDYVIALGDTLSKIAGRYGMTSHELYDYDGGTGTANRQRLRSGNPDLIYPDEIIRVPVKASDR
ncbi:LysM peptidoglycan-binding domain-containing protein [Candidatus Bathyarchaeota archaeon]|nr:LysM peptidoglycan-binding domain-containing protein [Candidatus Bathyarchaeota archaeon]